MLYRVSVGKLYAFLSAIVILAICIFLAVPARAQVVGATLSGTVSDPSGATIGGALVSITNKATGVTREVTSDTAGYYSVPNLLPATYDVTVTAKGFSTSKQTDITLGVGAQQVLNVPLRIGEANQTIEVAAIAPMVQLGSSTLMNEVESATVRELPLNGRDWASLATLQPGVNAIETQLSFEAGAGRGNRGFGAQLTISGGRPTQNNYRLDGLSINDYGNGAPGSVIGVNLGVDAIQEFSVLTGNYSAEYGKTSGGVVNAISKSGTNAFHGDVYEFLRNEKLDASTFLANAGGQGKPPFKRNQFGVAAGGPIRRDRTFIFGDYEGIRQRKGITQSPNVPSPAARAGNLASGQVIVDPAAAKFLTMYPLPNGIITGDRGRYTFNGVQAVTENYFTTRVDHKIGTKDNLFGTYMHDDNPYIQPDGLGNATIQSHSTRNIAALEDTHVFSPALVNTTRLGFNRAEVLNYQGLAAINPAAADKSLGSVPGWNAPRVFIGGGFTTIPGGVNTQSFYRHFWNSYQLYDDAFLTRGTHSLKFGFAVENMRYNFITYQNPGGTWRFGSLANFLTNKPNSFETGLPDALSPRGTRQTLYAGYIQDDWRVRPRLTMNIGLRYEMTTVLKERQGKFTNLINITDPKPSCLAQYAGCGGTFSELYSNPTLKNFEPRLGFAWDPTGSGKTAIRGGAAIFDVLPLPGYFILQQNQAAPFFLLGTVQNSSTPLAGTFYTGGFSKLGVNSLSVSITERNPKRSYVEQWNINVQHQITPSLTASVGYVGSHGVHMIIRGDDGDMVIPKETSAGFLWPYPAGSGTRINPNFGSFRYLFWSTGANYNGLAFSVQKRLSHGLQFQGSYTYSKAMDNSSATIAGDTFSNSITSWFWFAPQISHAVSDFNVTHSAVINGIWQVPTPRSFHGRVAAVLGGWEVGGILKMNSGIPTTPVIGGDPLGVQNGGSDAFALPNIKAGCDPVNHNFKSSPGGVFLGYVNVNCFDLPRAPASLLSQCTAYPKDYKGQTDSCQNLLGNGGRNSIVGPSLVNLDFSVFKNNYIRRISESFNLQFRAEFFNVLNHANFAPPLPFSTGALFNQDGSLAGGGGLDHLVTDPRDIQLALKVIW
jgi:hypothetical protein